MDTEYLADMLNGYGYNQNLLHKTDWLMSDFPYLSQMERVRTNVADFELMYTMRKMFRCPAHCKILTGRS